MAHGLILFSMILTVAYTELSIPPCNGRQVFNSSSGIISDGTNEYQRSSHCEWLISGEGKKYISLEFVSMSTECTYDYLFVYDGSSFNDVLIGAFSGESDPGTLVARSGAMMIYFFSDRNYERQGFWAKYFISSCLYNCSGRGQCSEESGTCSCYPNYTGEGCESLICPESCGEHFGFGECTSEGCKCESGRYGEGCKSSLDRNQPGWRVLAERGLRQRAGHSGVFFRDPERLYVFGGKNLSTQLDDMSYFDLSMNTWLEVEKRADTQWPKPRYGHTMVPYKNRFVIMFGGAFNEQDFTNEFWVFDKTTEVWLSPVAVGNRPPGLTGHAMTLTEDGNLFVLGGMSSNGKFLSDLWKCDVNAVVDDSAEFDADVELEIRFEKMSQRGGKSLDRRLVGHSMVYDKDFKRLIVYGGIAVDNARFPRRSSAVLLYHLDINWWTDLSFSSSFFTPKERAYHQATIVGRYMVVVGGNVHSHHKDENCYDENIYFFNLRCLMWVDGRQFEKPSGALSRIKGRYSHFITSFEGVVYVVGGFRGSLLGSLEAYVLPTNLTSVYTVRNSSCNIHRTAEACGLDVDCVWSTGGSQPRCVYKIQFERCLHTCQNFRTCEACVTFGRERGCYWCVLDSQCRESDSKNKCNMTRGWWGDAQTRLFNIPECLSLDKPPGLHWLRYKNPTNFQAPDEFEILRNSTSPFQFAVMDKDYTHDAFYTARFRGFIHPPYSVQPIQLYIYGSYVRMRLFLSNDSSVSNSELLVETNQTYFMTTNVQRRSGGALFASNSSKYYVELFINQSTPSGSSMTTVVGLKWNYPPSPTRKNQPITMEYLEPFGGGECSSHETCSSCMTDISCGWCVDRCASRELVATSSTDRCSPLLKNSSHFIVDHVNCPLCSNHTQCTECLHDRSCEWVVVEAKCFRRGEFNVSLTDLSSCPIPCHERNNVSWCLQDKNECAWCEEKSRCFAFVEYIPRYMYGGCRSWVDGATEVAPSSVCHEIDNCSSCLKTQPCGWCLLVENPSIGVCRSGDFAGPYGDIECDSEISYYRNASSATMWSYHVCRDVDECALDLHDCHENATCVNVYNSYNCICNRGFEGDGFNYCNKTCFEDCQQGECSGHPDYVCQCYVGWTGAACDVDCGCNFHSTCSTGVGTCDECLHKTTGRSCELCLPGFYANATNPEGCQPCECHGHADEKLGSCDGVTGTCFCKDDTTGRSCDVCLPGFYGDSRFSGRCYRECEGRTIILNAKEGGLGTFNVKDDVGHLSCFWIVTTHGSLEGNSSTSSKVITLTVDSKFNISCYKDRLYIYDGLPATLVASLCGENLKRDLIFNIYSGYLVVFFEFARQRNSSAGVIYYGFNATYSVGIARQNSCDEEKLCEKVTSRSMPTWGGVPMYDDGDGIDNTVDNLVSLSTPLTISNGLSTSSEGGRCVIASCLPPNLNKLMGHSIIRCHDDASGTDRMFLFGGRNYVEMSNDLWYFDTGASRWFLVQPESSVKPAARYLHASECTDDFIFVHGGVVSNGSVSDEMWKFHLKNKLWSLVEPPTNQTFFSLRLAMHTMTFIGQGQLILIGSEPSLMNLNFILKFNLLSNTWTTLKSPPLLRGIYGHTSIYNEETKVIYVHGGYQFTEDGFHVSRSLHMFSVDDDVPKWATLSNDPLAPALFMHYAFSVGKIMIVAGGGSTNSFYAAFSYTTNQWISLDYSGTETSLPQDLEAFGPPFWNGDVLFGTAAPGGFRYGVVTRRVFDVCKMLESLENGCLKNCSGCGSLECSRNCSGNLNNLPGSESILFPDNSFSVQCASITSCNKCVDASYRCKWCSSCSKCIYLSEDCASYACSKPTFFTSPLLSSSSPSPLSLGCEQEKCTAVSCFDCLKDDTCAWMAPVCDEFGCSSGKCLKKPESGTNVTNPLQSVCPSPCSSYSTCSQCFHHGSECLWSLAKMECLSGFEVGLRCSFGECGSMLKWENRHMCWNKCSKSVSCASCIRRPHCGWCYNKENVPGPGGEGKCMEGGLEGPYNDKCQTDELAKNQLRSMGPSPTTKFWTFMTCPPENECLNGHHNCSVESQFCVDTLHGFECQCKSGFTFNNEKKECQPHCNQGCVFGTCVRPNGCRCSFGYVGQNCSTECRCNKHSNCASEDSRFTCLSCQNNTMGDTCEKCKPLFVGNPQNGGKCISCLSHCNEHSRVCLSKEEFNYTQSYPQLPTHPDNITQWLKFGSYDSKSTKCLSCENNTYGDRCEKCENGHFRLPDLPASASCQKCMCNGHSDYCDQEKGDGCDCKNNTKSPRCDASDPTKMCFKIQCSQCVDNFLGTPTEGHQCYRQMSVESQQCLDPSTQMNCNPTRNPKPLLQNRTIFFAIQPKYLNVNIRIFIDVTKGGLNLFFAPFDNAFQVVVDPYNGVHRVFVDPAYKLYDPVNNATINADRDDDDPNDDYENDYNNDDDGDINVTREDLDEDDQEDDDDDGTDYSTTTPPREYNFHPIAQSPTKLPKSKRGFMTSLNRNTKHHHKSASTTSSPASKSTAKLDLPKKNKPKGPEKLFHMERVRADGPITFVTVSKPETFLFAENIMNRLVVILPNNVHPLKVARFYIVLLGAQPETYGAVFMRQDQPHIDLFVFFSVFFSCFFLFLAVCVLLWKAKQMNDARRSRHRSRWEMELMASRPSAHVIVIVDGMTSSRHTSPREQQRGKVPKSDTHARLTGAGLESGDNKSGGTIGAKSTRMQNKKSKNFFVHPIAVEYANDNAVAVATFLFDLPGANSARIRSCFGSCLVLPGSNLQYSSKV